LLQCLTPTFTHVLLRNDRRKNWMTFNLSPAVLDAALAAAVEAAQAAGAIMDECFERRVARDASFELGMDTKSSAVDLVTKYDKQCEDVVIEMLTHFTADVDGSGPRTFRFLSEESRPDEPLLDEPTWVIDPIDGTTSFVHNSFDCGVSIGLAVNRQPVLGVVLLPRLKELFTAVKGRGALYNGRPIRVSGCKEANKAVFCTHCPYNRAPEALAALQGMNTALLAEHKVHALRSYGSAAMDACSVAFGRLDCYFEVCIQSWDMCAAVIILLEAGGVVTDVNGGPLDLTRRGMIAAATPELAAIALELCTKYRYRENLLGSP
jgi:fructose-1,6-bisphosphatase/inositol monophosphatase family enzyme